MMKVMEEDSVLLQHWAKEGLERLGLDMVYIKPRMNKMNFLKNIKFGRPSVMQIIFVAVIGCHWR